MDAEGKHYHEVIAMDGTLISSHLVQWPANTPKRASVALTYASENNQYVIVRAVYSINCRRNGNASDYYLHNGARHSPVRQALVADHRMYDSDIAKLLPSQSNLAQPVIIVI